MLNFRYATIEDINLLVTLRIRDLKMFSNKDIDQETISKIKEFYQTGIENNTCFTLLGFEDELLVATGTLYLYSIMPSNDNPLGVMGQITNIWVAPGYRHQGIASSVVEELIEQARDTCGAVCLNASKEAIGLYQKLGFKIKERYMVRIWD